MRPRFRAFSRYRPRVLTLVVLFLIAAPMTLANFTSEIVPAEEAIHGREMMGTHQGQYGWPLVWHWHNLQLFMGPVPCGIFNWEYSPARLAGSVALWLLMLAVPAGGCEWLLRRYRPRVRFSLRTLLVAVAVAGVCCAWFAAARNRANVQDPLIAEIQEGQEGDGNKIMIERPGPKWLEFIVPDRFRRHIIGIRINDSVMLDEALAKRLAALSRLKYLRASVERWTPGMSDSLAGLRRLRWLCIENRYSDSMVMRGPGGENESSDDEDPESEDTESENPRDEAKRAAREFYEGIGKLTQIEALCIEDWVDFPRDDLRRLAGMKKLKVLIVTFGSSHSQGMLSHLPALPQLESVHIEFTAVSGQDLRHLVVFPRLKSLDVTDAKLDGAELADLAPLQSLEELTIDADFLPKQTLESLRSIKQLKSLFIGRDFAITGILGGGRSGPTATLAIDEGDRLWVPEGEVDVFRSALETLRQSNPGIVIKKTQLGVLMFDWSAPFEYEEPELYYSTWLPADSSLAPPSRMRRFAPWPRSSAGQSTSDKSGASAEE